MTKKDYVAIAEVINNVGDAPYYEDKWIATDALLKVAQGLAEYAAKDNVDFNRAKFIAACFKYQTER